MSLQILIMLLDRWLITLQTTGLKKIGILSGLETTTDQEEVIADKRLDYFKSYMQEKENF